MRKLTEEEYCGEQGYKCKAWECAHFRLERFVANYCMVDVCNFKENTREACKNPRGISGHFVFRSRGGGNAWHGNWGE